MTIKSYSVLGTDIEIILPTTTPTPTNTVLMSSIKPLDGYIYISTLVNNVYTWVKSDPINTYYTDKSLASETNLGVSKLTSNYLNTGKNTAVNPDAVKSTFEYLSTTATELENVGIGKFRLPDKLTPLTTSADLAFFESCNDTATTAGYNKYIAYTTRKPLIRYDFYNMSTLKPSIILPDTPVNVILAPQIDLSMFGITPNSLNNKDDVGMHHCNNNSNANSSDGYPVQAAGCLEVLPSVNSIMQRYSTYNNSGAFQRNLSDDDANFDTWYKISPNAIPIWNGTQDVQAASLTVPIPTTYIANLLCVNGHQTGSLGQSLAVLPMKYIGVANCSINYYGVNGSQTYGNVFVKRSGNNLIFTASAAFTIENIDLI